MGITHRFSPNPYRSLLHRFGRGLFADEGIRGHSPPIMVTEAPPRVKDSGFL